MIYSLNLRTSMDRLEEISKQIAELEAERMKLIMSGYRTAESDLDSCSKSLESFEDKFVMITFKSGEEPVYGKVKRVNKNISSVVIDLQGIYGLYQDGEFFTYHQDGYTVMSVDRDGSTEIKCEVKEISGVEYEQVAHGLLSQFLTGDHE